VIIKSIDMIPEVFWRESDDFRVFLTAIDQAYDEVFDKTERIVDCIDPLNAQENLLPRLAHRLGFVYDWRFQAQFNRLVLYHFPQMIYNRGSITGVTLGAMVNLASIGLDAHDAVSERERRYFLANNRDAYSRSIQVDNSVDSDADPVLRIDSESINYETEMRARAITEDRLNDVSLPNNAVSVSVNDIAIVRDSMGNLQLKRNEPYYINVVYFSETIPEDACLEYVRPLGMYLFTFAGVKLSAKNEILLHPKLADQFADNTPYNTPLQHPVNPGYTARGAQRIDPNAKFSPSIYGGLGNYNRPDFATLQRFDDPISNPQGIVPWTDLDHPLYQSSNTPEFQQWLVDNAVNFAVETPDDVPTTIAPRCEYEVIIEIRSLKKFSLSHFLYGEGVNDRKISDPDIGLSLTSDALEEYVIAVEEQTVDENDQPITETVEYYVIGGVNPDGTPRGTMLVTSTVSLSDVAERLTTVITENGGNVVSISSAPDKTNAEQEVHLPPPNDMTVSISEGTLSVNGLRIFPSPAGLPIPNHKRKKFWSRNNTNEANPRNSEGIYDAGYNTLYSFQLSNNEHTVRKLMPKVFELGYLPTHSRNADITVDFMEGNLQEKTRMFNLQYADGRLQEESLLKDKIRFGDVLAGDTEFVSDSWAIQPGVNPTAEHYPPSSSVDQVNRFADGTENINPKPNTDEQSYNEDIVNPSEEEE